MSNILSPTRTDLPKWKQFWVDRGFAKEMKTDGIINDEPPAVVNKIVQTGPYCMVVVDYRDMSYSHASGIEQMLGYNKEELYKGKFEFLMNILHPEDKEKVLGLAVHFYRFLDQQPLDRQLDFKVSLNFRMRRADGSYVRVLEQVVALRQNEEGKVTHALKYFSDISHLNYSNEVVLAILDDKGQGSQNFFTFNLEDKTTAVSNSILSARELEILKMIVKGKTSKEIATDLNLSVHTINKHRENMMQKTGSKNLNEVISFAYCNDYI